MWEYITQFIQSNDFLSGGLILSGLAGVVVLMRQKGAAGIGWLYRQFVISMEVRNTDVSFDWLIYWLDQQPYSKKSRKLTVSVIGHESDVTSTSEDDTQKQLIIFSPAVGDHVFFYKKRLLWLNRSREDSQNSASLRQRESITIRIFGRSQHLLRELLREAHQQYAKTLSQRSRIYTSQFSYWSASGYTRQRPLHSVILPDNQIKQIIEDVQTFLSREAWYHKMGIPYRRGYLFHGVPGSGKSSLVAAIAGEIGMSLYIVSLSGMTDDSDLQSLLNNVSAPKAILLFEDIDQAKAAKRRSAVETDNDSPLVKTVTVSGLLNALDGVACRDGYITIMTTNHRQSLDSALTRPGRVDMEIEFKHATASQAILLYERFFGKDQAKLFQSTLNGNLSEQVSMADLQEHFLKNLDKPDAAMKLEIELG